MHTRQVTALYIENAKQNMVYYTIHHKWINKREKDMGLDDIHNITIEPSRRRVRKNELAKLAN